MVKTTTLIALVFVSLVTYASGLFETRIAVSKVVNGDFGVELSLRGINTIGMNTEVYYTVSETFTANRDNLANLNHEGIGVDIGCQWKLFGDFVVGYSHYNKNLFPGAFNTNVYRNNDTDTVWVGTRSE